MDTIEAMFDSRIIPEPNTGCHLWTGYTRGHFGYGGLTYLGKKWQAHRLAWVLGNGEIPGSLRVLHKCDVPLCVNVKHLFLGSDQDNMADQIVKNRFRCYPKGVKAKLKLEEVKQIRESRESSAILSRR